MQGKEPELLILQEIILNRYFFQVSSVCLERKMAKGSFQGVYSESLEKLVHRCHIATEVSSSVNTSTVTILYRSAKLHNISKSF